MRTRRFFMPLAMLVMAFALGSCFPEQRTNEDQEKEIQDFIISFEYDHKEEGLKFTKTESGLYYCISKEGVGENAQKGQIIKYIYDVKYLTAEHWTHEDDEEAEENDDIILGETIILPGIEEAFSYMNVGCELFAIVPSHLAYGDYSFYTDPFTPWLFWLRVDNIRNPGDPEPEETDPE